MNNCEIVDNVACGQTFQYCRTHKVEPKDCPGAAAADPYNLISATRAFKDIHDESITTSPKREFKIGDRVRVVDCGIHHQLLNMTGVVNRICNPGSLRYLDGGTNDEPEYSLDTMPNNIWSAKYLEHA